MGQYPPTMAQQYLEAKGPGWFPLSEREERLFTNRSNRPGDDMNELRTDSDPVWRGYCAESILAIMQARSTIGVSWGTWNIHRHVCPSARRTSHCSAVHRQSGRCIHEEVASELVDSACRSWVSWTVPMRRRKKRKQVDDGTAICNCTQHWPLTTSC